MASLLFNVGIFLLLILLFHPSFETNDDGGLLSIVCGAKGIRDPHMVHSNYLLGLTLVKLFEVAPTVSWTTVLQYALLFASFFSATVELFKLFKSPYMRLFIMMSLTWFAYEGYVRIQYTKTAGMITAMGLIIIFCELLQEEINIAQIAIGFAIAIIGSFYRIQQFCCVVALFGSLVVYLILVSNKNERKERILKSLALGFTLLVIAFGLRAYDRVQYNSTEWTDYLEFDKYRTEVIDYGVPDYNEHEEDYNAIGIDKTAYNLMKDWTFQDSEKFTAESFKRIGELRAQKTINVAFFKTFSRKIAKGLLKEGTFICFVCIALGWLLFGRHSKEELIAFLILLTTIAVLYMYLYYAGRFMIHRVDVGIWMAASVITLSLYNSERNSKIVMLFAIAMLVLFVTRVQWSEHLRYKATDTQLKAASEKAAMEEIHDDQEHIYLTKVGTLSLSKAYGSFDAVPFEIADNVYPLGGWTAETPVYKSVLKRYGINNPMKDMIDNSSVYLIDNDIDKTINYLRKWHNSDSKAVIVKKINDKTVYKIVTN